MSHFDDQVDATTELFLKSSLAKRHKVLTHSGLCYNCDETVGEGVFSSADCREDYEKRERLKPKQD